MTDAPAPTVVQIAYRVDDLERDARTVAEMTGAGPFFVQHHVPFSDLRSHAADGATAPTTIDLSIALGQWGSVQLELIEYHDVQPAQARHDLVGPPVGLHHVARFCADLDGECDRLVAAGALRVLDGMTGPISFAYLRMPGGGLLELFQQAGRITRVFDLVRDAAVGWDGTDALRPIELLGAQGSARA